MANCFFFSFYTSFVPLSNLQHPSGFQADHIPKGNLVWLVKTGELHRFSCISWILVSATVLRDRSIFGAGDSTLGTRVGTFQELGDKTLGTRVTI